MSYVLGSLGAAPVDPVADFLKKNPWASVLSGVLGSLIEPARAAARQQLSEYAAFNLFRFNDQTITSIEDKKLTSLNDRKDGVLIKATQVYQTYEAAIRVAAMAVHFTPKPTLQQVKKLAYDTFVNIYRALLGYVEPPPGGANTQSTTDNTMLYVGLAAAAVVGIGLMRRRQ